MGYWYGLRLIVVSTFDWPDFVDACNHAYRRRRPRQEAGTFG